MEDTKDGGRTLEDGAKPEKVVFTEAQQMKIQELIDATYRKAYAKASKAATSEEVERLQAEIARLKPLAEAAQGLEEEKAKVAQERKRLQVRLALARYNLVDIDAAERLVMDNIGWDAENGRPIVYGPDSEPLLDESGREKSLDAFVADFLRDRSYLLRSAPTTGAGSFQQERGHFLNGSGMKRADFDKLEPREKLRYIAQGGKPED